MMSAGREHGSSAIQSGNLSALTMVLSRANLTCGPLRKPGSLRAAYPTPERGIMSRSEREHTVLGSEDMIVLPYHV